MIAIRGLALVVVAACLIGAAPSPAPKIVLNKIAARLYWADQGEWSDNKLAKSSTWTGWNSIIGEGDAGGAVNDVMIDVSLSPVGADDAFFAKQPLVITATAGKKLLGKRVVKDILMPYRGATHVALFLTDAACVGGIDLVATYGKQVRKARLNMDCGE